METIAADLEAIRDDANAPTETVTYTRRSGAGVAAGFPKTIAVFCPISMQENRAYEDGMAEKETLRATIGEASIGGNALIDDDSMTRTDGTTWRAAQITKRHSGFVEVIFERVSTVERGARGYRMNR